MVGHFKIKIVRLWSKQDQLHTFINLVTLIVLLRIQNQIVKMV